MKFLFARAVAFWLTLFAAFYAAVTGSDTYSTFTGQDVIDLVREVKSNVKEVTF